MIFLVRKYQFVDSLKIDYHKWINTQTKRIIIFIKQWPYIKILPVEFIPPLMPKKVNKFINWNESASISGG